jgi:hypothetical protein
LEYFKPTLVMKSESPKNKAAHIENMTTMLHPYAIFPLIYETEGIRKWSHSDIRFG